MRPAHPLAVALTFALLAGCSKSSSPTNPGTPTPTPTPGSGNVTGIAVDAVTDRALAGVAVQIDGVGNATTGSDGRFALTTTASEQLRGVTITSATTVTRTTHMRAPGPEARLTLMPTSLDLKAFDEMFRGSASGNNRLQRWTSAPRIAIQTRVLKFTGTGDTEYVATGQTMSDAEVTALLGDLTFGLGQLTGNAFTAFAEEARETAAEGDRVPVTRTGWIVVARYEGLTAGTAPSSYWGYSRWQTLSGEVRAGVLMIDSGFDTSGSQYRRSLRVHELGHTLGYNHVTVGASVMNSHARFEPNAFDRDASRFAFLRPILNRTPDIDPDPYSLNLGIPATPVWYGAR